MGAFANESEHKTLTKTLFGKDLKSGKAWSIFALRLALGFMFLYGGYEKIETELSGGLATKGFLSHVAGPFAGIFTSMSGNLAVEYLLVYGELIIVKHNANFLSAYGHNRKRLVQEGERVRGGQQIAEMGSSGAARDELHFEIRKGSTPVDPRKYLNGA